MKTIRGCLLLSAVAGGVIPALAAANSHLPYAANELLGTIGCGTVNESLYKNENSQLVSVASEGEPEPALPILIDTGYEATSTNGGVEVTVVMEVANVAPTNMQALLTLNVGNRENAVGVAVDEDCKLSGISETACPFGKWKNFGAYADDGKTHRIAFGYAGTGAGACGTGGYRGSKLVIDGTNVHQSGDLVYANEVVRRIALGGGFDKPGRTLAGAAIKSYAVYPAALNESEMKALTKNPMPVKADMLAVNFHTPADNRLGIEYVLGDLVWTNELAMADGENYWRVAEKTELTGAGGAATLVYRTPDNAGQTLLAGGKGLNPNANLKTAAQHWQVAVPLNIPDGYSFAVRRVLPEMITLNLSCAQQGKDNDIHYSANVSIVRGATTNETGRIGPSSQLNLTKVNTVTGGFAEALTLSGDNTLLFKMYRDANDTGKAGVYTAALGVKLYAAEEEDPDVPTADFSYAPTVGAKPTGWMTGFGGESFTAGGQFRVGPTGECVSVVSSGQHPWYNLSGKSNYSMALYADISQVARDKTGRYLVELGGKGNGINQGVMMLDDGNVCLFEANGATARSTTVKTATAPTAGYHLIVWTQSTADGATLYVDGEKIGTDASMTSATSTGFQLGSMHGGVWNGNYGQAYGMAVAGVFGWDRVLTDEQVSNLAKRYPAVVGGSEAADVPAAITGTLNLVDGDSIASGEYGCSLAVAFGATVDLLYGGEIVEGAEILSATSITAGTARFTVNGEPLPKGLAVQSSEGKLIVGKSPVVCCLNPFAVRDGDALKVTSNTDLEQAGYAYDGNAATYFKPTDEANANGVSWTGIAFTNGVIVSRIVYSGNCARRMIGGAFQGANANDFSDAENICVVESYSGGTADIALDEAKGPYKYLRFIGMYGGNVSEIAYYGLADSGALAPTNAPVVTNTGSAGKVATFTVRADAEIPQVFIAQRAMADFCDDDDYETFVTLAPALGRTVTWTDTEQTDYAKYRVKAMNANGSSAWTCFDIVPEKLIDGPDKPTFEGAKPGFYANATNVTISYNCDGAKIYYTTDGSTPTTNSTLYTGPIALGDVCARDNPLSLIMTNPKELTNNIAYGWRKPTDGQPNVNVIRARAFLPDGSASKFDAAGTWMVGETANDHRLRVVSLQTDRDNFFGDPKGIMVPGDIYNEKGFGSHSVGMPNANYFQSGDDWERPAQIEIFETDRSEMLAAQIGTRVRGFWSRSAAKKSLTCYFRKEYGTKNAKAALFGDEGKKKFKRFLLRNGGNDWYKACLRDAVGQSMFRGFVNTGTQGYEPSVLYVNGEYWGLYNLRHCYSKHHFEEWGDGAGDDIDYVKLTPESGEHFELQEGDFNAMWDIMQYMIKVTDDGEMTDAEYAKVEAEVDIDDMIDYHIVNIFLCNADWVGNGNNMGYWRNRSGDDRKWHFTVYDCDSAMGFDDNSSAGSDKLSVALNVNDENDGAAKMAPGFLKRCFKNAGFRRRFANRFADLLNTALRAERTTNIVAQAGARIEPEIERTAARWTNMESLAKWQSRLGNLRQFFVDRPANVFKHLNSHCDGGGLSAITVMTNGLGKVTVNSVESGTHFDFPFEGQYFSDIPITLTAAPEGGRAFACWKSGDTVVSSNATVVLAPTNGVTLTACFAEPQKDPDLIEGDYPGGLTVTVTNGMTLKIGNATFGGPLTLTGEKAVGLNLLEGATATMPKIDAAGSSLTIDGAGTLVMSNSATLITCADLVMSNGVLDLAFTGVADKDKAVLLTGNLLQYGGDISLNLESSAQVFGFYSDTKEMEAKFFGGTFAATVNGGEKSAAVKMNKGSSHVTLDGGSWTAMMSGTGPRFANTDGKIKIKSGTIEVKTADGLGTGANVLTCKKEMTITGGTITGRATGAGSEVFSSDTTIAISGGTISVEAADDCFSATGVTISGGKVQALSYAGDAIDSNGDVTIEGGDVFATTCAADGYGIEANGAFVITGGRVVAVGGPNRIHAPDECDVPCYTNGDIATLKKYLVLTSDYLESIEKLSVNLKAGEKRYDDGFSLVAAVPNMYGTYTETDTKPDKKDKLDDDLDGVFVTTLTKDEPSVVPGVETPTYDTEEAATNMAAQTKVSRPAEVASSNVVSEADYAAMFEVKAKRVEKGESWVLKPELKPVVSNEVQTATDEALTNETLMATMTTETPTASVTTKAGLFYGMAATDDLDDLGEALIPFGRWVLGTGGQQELKADKPSETNGFYQIRVQIEPPKR